MWMLKEEAKEYGMTHEGKLYGVSVWLRFNERDRNRFDAAPKFVPFMLWIRFCEFMYDTAEYFIPEGYELYTPMTVGEQI